MIYAYILRGNNERKQIHITEYTDDMHEKIFCDLGHPVIAKRGDIMMHHFAHKGNCVCPLSDNKGDWHITWQNRIKKEFQEKRIYMDNKLHIADICTSKYIIEIQHSSMNEKTIKLREKFYTSLTLKDIYTNNPSSETFTLVWIFDYSNSSYQKVRSMYDSAKKKHTCTIKILNGPKFYKNTTLFGNVITILDFGKRELFVVQSISGQTIHGYIISMEEFDNIYLGDNRSPDNDMRIYRHSML